MRIKRRVAVIAVTTLGLVGLAGPALAGTSGKIALKPVVVNPCGGAVESGAVAQWEQGTGMNDNSDPEYFGLHLRPGGSCTIASATFTNVKGVVLSKLGFSVRDDTPCSGGNPRGGRRRAGRRPDAARCPPVHQVHVQRRIGDAVLPPQQGHDGLHR